MHGLCRGSALDCTQRSSDGKETLDTRLWYIRARGEQPYLFILNDVRGQLHDRVTSHCCQSLVRLNSQEHNTTNCCNLRKDCLQVVCEGRVHWQRHKHIPDHRLHSSSAEQHEVGKSKHQERDSYEQASLLASHHLVKFSCNLLQQSDLCRVPLFAAHLRSLPQQALPKIGENIAQRLRHLLLPV